MAKKTYRIPHSLNVSRLQAPIILTGKRGEGPFKRPVKISTVIFLALLGLLVPMFLYMNTGISEGSRLGILLMLIGWEMFVGLLIVPQENGDEGYKMIWPTIGYWLDTHGRIVSTRGDANVAEVSDVLQIRKIDNQGVITFVNGWVGRAYEVDGHASNMLFENERDYVIDAFERWLQLLPPNVSVNIPTQHTALDLSEQVQGARKRTANQRLTDLRALADRKERVIREKLVGNDRFRTVSQYIVLTTTDRTELAEQSKWFENQVRSGMAKSIRPADFERTLELLRGIFTP